MVIVVCYRFSCCCCWCCCCLPTFSISFLCFFHSPCNSSPSPLLFPSFLFQPLCRQKQTTRRALTHAACVPTSPARRNKFQVLWRCSVLHTVADGQKRNAGHAATYVWLGCCCSCSCDSDSGGSSGSSGSCSGWLVMLCHVINQLVSG